MTAPTAIYMPAAQAVLLRIGEATIELSTARIDEFMSFLRLWSLATSITIGNDTGRVVIRAGQEEGVATAIANALATRDHAVAMLAA